MNYMNTQMLVKSALFITLLFAANSSYSQVDTTQRVSEGLSLEDLLSVEIVSVSKKSEFLFDAPLSASVVTKEDIRRAGSSSIKEALRLFPGVIVREHSNGNFDIHIRGMNIPPNSSFVESTSSTMLVMIDNRPVHSY